MTLLSVFINVEDETSLVFVRVENNEIEEVQKYQKKSEIYTPSRHCKTIGYNAGIIKC